MVTLGFGAATLVTTTTSTTSTTTTTSLPPCTYDECLPVDLFDTTIDGWTRVGSTPYLDTWSWSDYVYSNTDGAETGDYGFQNTTYTNPIKDAVIQVRVKSVSGNNDKVQVWVWETTWHLAGVITPDEVDQIYTLDVSGIIDTPSKVNAAKIRLEYEEVT